MPDDIVLTQGGKQLPPEVPMNEAEVEDVPEGSVEDLQSNDELSEEELEGMIASKDDVDACIDAIRELTEVVGEINAKVEEVLTTLKAGKF